MIEQIFPQSCFTATGDLTGDVPPLFPEEKLAIQNAVPKRRIEFAFGRHTARVALGMMGLGCDAIPVGPDRAPIWPSGVVGSITHCDGFAGAVVASKENFAGLGLDAEAADPINDGLVHKVCSDQEIEALGDIHSDELTAAKLVFSAKEAVFKAVFPGCGIWLEFEDVELDFESSDRSFRVSWFEGARGLPRASRLTGSFRITPDHVFCGVVLSAV